MTTTPDFSNLPGGDTMPWLWEFLRIGVSLLAGALGLDLIKTRFLPKWVKSKQEGEAHGVRLDNLEKTFQLYDEQMGKLGDHLKDANADMDRLQAKLDNAFRIIRVQRLYMDEADRVIDLPPSRRDQMKIKRPTMRRARFT